MKKEKAAVLRSRIEELCKEKDVKPTQVFVQSGVGKIFFYNLKKSEPSYEKVQRLANFFNTSVDYLIGLSNIKDKPFDSTTEELIKLINTDAQAQELLLLFRELLPEAKTSILAEIQNLVALKSKEVKKMTHATRLPSGSWRSVAQYYDEVGVRHRKSITAKTEAEANYKAEQFEKKHPSSMPAPENITLGAAIDKYIDDKTGKFSPATLTGYRQIRRNYFKELFKMPLSRIDARTIQNAIDDDSEHSAKSVYNAFALVSAVINKYLPDITLSSIELPKRQRCITPIPDEQQISQILQAVSGTEIDIAVSLAVYLGLRMSEVFGLRYTDIINGKAYIHNTIVDSDEGRVEKPMTKTAASTRVVSVPKRLLKKIEEQEKASDSPYIVPLTLRQVYKHFIRILKKSGLPHFRLHDLRHYNASVMLRLGVPTKYQMARGGWSSDSTLQTVYQHTMADYASEIDNRIYEYIDKLADNKKNS